MNYIKKNNVILGHHNGDPDALGAAQGIKELINILKPGSNTEIVFPEDISKLTYKIIKDLELDVKEEPSIKQDTIIIVDTGQLSQLGKWEKIIKKKDFSIVSIDHHIFNEEISQISDCYIHKPEFHSTSEIVYELFQEYKLTPSKITAMILLTGIAFDSKFFNIGDSKMFQKVSNLLKITGEISTISELMKTSPSISEKIARIKSAQRGKIHKIKNWIIVTSIISSYHASGARGLISLGADVAIVAGSKKEKLRASLRSTQNFYQETSINMGHIAKELGKLLNGEGSGHPTAAGFNGTGELEELTTKILDILREKLT
jgi:nanoRNase/pAp phosphatase (c-di-AMP/oligoRNAs hydrolase)